ncbi:MAG TPA: serine-threonine protein kinase [Actinomycetota bacterium]|nr:serine-threonine protein kinase [Actinomycetota bacterium]
MASEIAGQPHWEIGFDEHGKAAQGEVDALLAELPGKDLTDLFVFSHGWNNDRRQARRLYQLYFQQVPGLLGRGGGQGARVGTLGVVWPSKRWADEPEPTGDGGGGGAAGLGDAAAAAAPADDTALVEDLKDVFEGDQQRQALDELARLLEERPEDPAALARFQTLMGELAGAPDAEAAGEDQGELALLEDDPEEVFGRFADAVPQTGEGGAAGIGDAFGRLWDGAKEALRQLTYFEMKKRAGVVGKQGLGPLLGRIHQADPELRIHLLGHSFGARLVSFALAGLPDGTGSPVKSLYLLQGAFSHFAFADALPMDRSRGGALKGMAARVDGPLVASFTVHDLAVGKLYPLAALSSRDDAAGLEDRLFRWGGIGHDGAQAVDATVAALGPVGTGYPFQKGRFVNLDGNAIINRGGPPSGAHSDIFHPELVWAGLAAAGLVRAT